MLELFDPQGSSTEMGQMKFYVREQLTNDGWYAPDARTTSSRVRRDRRLGPRDEPAVAEDRIARRELARETIAEQS